MIQPIVLDTMLLISKRKVQDIGNYAMIALSKLRDHATLRPGEMVEKIHNKRLHGGIKDTMAAIVDEYFIPGLNRMIRKFIANSQHCQKEKR